MEDPLRDESTFDLRRVTGAIRSNSKIIALLFALALGLGLTVTLLQTPRYIAQATMQINDSGGRVLSEDEERDRGSGAGADTDRFLKTQVDLLKSRAMALRVAERLNLMSRADFFKAAGKPMPAPGTPIAAARDRAAGMMKGGLTVTLPRDSRIVPVEYESTNPQLAADIANAYVSEFIELNLQRKFDSSAYARDFLEKQLAISKRKVEDSEQALNNYTRSKQLIIPRSTGDSGGKSGGGSGGGNSVTTTSLIQLNTAFNDATAKRIAAETRWRAVAGASLSGNEVISNPTVVELQRQRSQVEAALTEERSRHMDDYPTVKAKLAEVANIDKQLRQAAASVRDAVHGEYISALNNEQQLQSQVSRLKNDTLTEQDQSVQYNQLAREADSNRQVYEGLLERYKQLNAVAGASLSNVAPVDKAVAPVVPSAPSLTKNMLIAGIAALVLSIILIYVKDQFDDSIRVPEDLEAKLGLHMLGVIPRYDGGPVNDALADLKSSLTEAYNSLRSSLIYSTSEGLPRVVLVTSAQPAEGKTTTSLSIGITLARLGKKVLLIDADMRRPALHRHLNYDNARGLSTLLTMQDTLDTVSQASGYENLTLISAGPVPPSPTELLSSKRMEEVLQEGVARYDVVLIDSPPVLGLADAPVLAPLADGVIFVVEADRSRRGSLKAALRRLRAMHPIMLGGVLTKFDAIKAGKEYSSYYGYYQYTYEQ